jgi:anaerobic selenocysteine-containing dehydrogenase
MTTQSASNASATAAASLSQRITTKHYRACNLCEAICGLEIELDQSGPVPTVVAIRGDPQDPLSQGHICPKASALADFATDPARLRLPQRRIGTGSSAQWQTISWDEALDEVATQLAGIKSAHGPHAIASFIGNPAVHNSGTLLSMPGLLRAIGSRNRYSATSIDQLPQQVASGLMLGHPSLLPVPDLERTMYWLILGANPLASNGSMMSAPGVRQRLAAIQKRGGKVVVIDPRRTETAKAASEHHFITPASDALLLLAMIETLFAEHLVNLGAASKYISSFDGGLEAVQQAVLPFSAERVAAQTGIEAVTIRRLAREFAGAESAVAYGRIGLSVQAFGGLCQWLVYLLNILSGNFDRAGGLMFPAPAFETVNSKRSGSDDRVGWQFGRHHTRVRGLPEANGEFPVAALAEEILTPGTDQVRALVVTCGNPVLSSPNGAHLAEALASLDFVVAIDPYLTETTRHAHIILPPAMGLETEHYDTVFLALALRNVARVNQALLPKAEGAKFDWQIIGELTQRLTHLTTASPDQPSPDQPSPAKPEAVRDPIGLVDVMLRRGRYQLSLAQLRAQPHGLDLGPLQPQCPARLQTPEGALRLAPQLYLDDLARLEAHLAAKNSSDPASFTLIGRRELRGNNSWMHQVARLNRDQPRCSALMHPQDAARLGLADGANVTVSSGIGAITLPLELTADITPGVISIPHGYGHAGRPDVPAHAQGVSFNDLSDPNNLDITGNAVLSGLRVAVVAA